MTDTHLLKYYISKNGDTIGTLADALSIKRSTLSAKINNKRDFKQSEMALIGKRYKMPMDICKKIFLKGWGSCENERS